MVNKDFFSKNDSELQTWLINFSAVFSDSGKKFGISSAEIASLSALIYSVTEDIRNGRSNEKAAEKEMVLRFVDKMIVKIKEHPSYNSSSIGEKLGID